MLILYNISKHVLSLVLYNKQVITNCINASTNGTRKLKWLSVFPIIHFMIAYLPKENNLINFVWVFSQQYMYIYIYIYTRKQPMANLDSWNKYQHFSHYDA